jgi:altronate dehydratase large subunit
VSTVCIPCDREGRLRVRRRVAVISAVACANIVCEKLAERTPELAVMTHQHGCGQLGEDMDLTREVLAALASHPNVARSVFISLGCETNTAQALVRATRRRGGTVDVVGIQATGGVDAAVAQAQKRLERVDQADLDAVDVPTGRLKVAVVADAATRERRPGLPEAVASALSGEGFRVLLATRLRLATRSAPADGADLSVTSRWRTEARSASDALRRLMARAGNADCVALSGNEVECMTVLTALGAHVIVVLAGRPNITGSSIAPTIKVSTAAELDGLDVTDVPFSPASLLERVVAAVREAAGGKPTRAERLGMRDLALPRLGPNY